MNWDRVERLFGAEALRHLQSKRVMIVGAGSGGGFVAQTLVMSGIRDFILLDSDMLEESNFVRHIADRRDIGRPKVEAVADILRHRNPDVRIQTVIGRFEDHLSLLDGVDLVISAVDGEGTKFQINEECLERHLTALYAGVYERGEGGDVVAIRPYDGPCYACWASTLRDGVVTPTPDSSGEMDYGLLNEHGTLDAEPGLWLHIVRVASAQADMALNLLLEGTPAYRPMPTNTVIMANVALEIVEGRVTPPYSAEWVNIPRDPFCLICGDRRLEAARQHLSLDEIAGDMLILEQDDAENQSTGERRFSGERHE